MYTVSRKQTARLLYTKEERSSTANVCPLWIEWLSERFSRVILVEIEEILKKEQRLKFLRTTIRKRTSKICTNVFRKWQWTTRRRNFRNYVCLHRFLLFLGDIKIRCYYLDTLYIQTIIFRTKSFTVKLRSMGFLKKSLIKRGWLFQCL